MSSDPDSAKASEWSAAKPRIIGHMNKDHAESLKAYLHFYAHLKGRKFYISSRYILSKRNDVFVGRREGRNDSREPKRIPFTRDLPAG